MLGPVKLALGRLKADPGELDPTCGSIPPFGQSTGGWYSCLNDGEILSATVGRPWPVGAFLLLGGGRKAAEV